jgi:uncharacterized protein YacL
LINLALRLALGIILAAAGYFLTWRVFPQLKLFGATLFLPPFIAFLLGVLGTLLVPVVSALARRFFFNFVQILARELIEQVPWRRMGRSDSEAQVPKKDFQNPMLIDTSAIIDGRVLEVAQAGFLEGTLIVPRFILGELQHIADSSDPLRRGRGRRGFEIIDQLKKVGGLKVEISDIDATNAKKPDDKLVQLGKKNKAKIITTDYNLNRVANISGVKILNVNELANSIKTLLLPGENVSVKVIQEGKEKDQGVGYLPDGTMIVIEGGARLVGETVEARVTRVFQTVAGRMIFVKQDDLRQDLENRKSGKKRSFG